MLAKTKKQPKFPKNIPEKNSQVLKDFKSCDRIFNKNDSLKKNLNLIDNRKNSRITKKHFREHLVWMGNLPLRCLECGTMHNIELHHMIPQDNRTVVPFCSYCHRGDLKDSREILIKEYFPPVNGFSNFKNIVIEGYYMHRGTESARFNRKWDEEILFVISNAYLEEHKKEIGKELKK